MSTFLPYLLGLDFHDDEPEVPYSGAVEGEKVEVSNAVMFAAMCLMLIEAVLDSKTLYIPIKIAFPRFITVVGVLLISLLPYVLDVGHGMDRLNFHACSMFAKGYFIVGGLSVQLLHDSAPVKEVYTWRFYMYSSAVVLFTANYQLHQWKSYIDPNSGYLITMSVVGVLSVLVALYFVFRAGQLLFLNNPDKFYGPHYYDLMSHVIVSLFFFGTYSVVIFSSAETWKDYTVTELVAYQYIDLAIIVLFFFTSSYIAQQNFVSAKVELATKKYFVRYISHEIRTPLNTVYMGIQLLTVEIKKAFEQKNESGDISKRLSSARESCENILHDINESVCISMNILNDLLLIDKIEEGTIRLEMKPINAYELFRSYIQHFNVQAQFSKIDLSVNLDDLRRINVVADEMKMAQVIRNAVSNALKFTPEGGHVHVVARFIPDAATPADSSPNTALKHFTSVQTLPIDKGKIRVEVYDTGPGISEFNKSKLFKNVIQFNPNELQGGGGSGLGLYISSAIMRQHSGGVMGVMPGGVDVIPRWSVRGDIENGDVEQDGGEVTLMSSDSCSRGCVFYIEMTGHKNMDGDSIMPFSRPPSERYSCEVSNNLPVQSPHGALSRSSSVDSFKDGSKLFSTELVSVRETSALTADGSMSPTLFRKVLIVEDSKFNRKMMQKLLSSYADEVVLAEDGVEGVAAVRECVNSLKDPFDVIFMDSLMPNMNGIDATMIILGELKFPNPIIAITGNMLPEDVREFEDAGAFTVLGKPLRLDKLDEVLHQIFAAASDDDNWDDTKPEYERGCSEVKHPSL